MCLSLLFLCRCLYTNHNSNKRLTSKLVWCSTKPQAFTGSIFTERNQSHNQLFLRLPASFARKGLFCLSSEDWGNIFGGKDLYLHHEKCWCGKHLNFLFISGEALSKPGWMGLQTTWQCAPDPSPGLLPFSGQALTPQCHSCMCPHSALHWPNHRELRDLTASFFSQSTQVRDSALCFLQKKDVKTTL